MTLSFWFPFGDSNFGSFRRDVFRGDIFLLHERWSLPCMRYKYHQRISTLESNSIGRRGATYKTLKKLPEFPERIFFHPEKPCFHHVFFLKINLTKKKKTVWGIPWFQQFVKKKKTISGNQHISHQTGSSPENHGLKSAQSMCHMIIHQIGMSSDTWGIVTLGR